MKNLVFAALVLGGLSQATGCIISSGDDDTGGIHASWSLIERLATDPPADNAIACGDAGVATIRVTSRPVGGGTDYVDLFDCIDQNGHTAALPTGGYIVWIDALDSGNGLVAESFSGDYTVTSGGTTGADFSFPVDVANMDFTWTLVDAATNAALSCSDVASGGVDVIATPVANQTTFTANIFNCEDGSGRAIDNYLGDNTVVVDILDQSDPPLALGTSVERTVTLDFGNQVEDLGNFEFAFN